jgi:hypothetical protein
MNSDPRQHLRHFRQCFLAKLDPIDWNLPLIDLHLHNQAILRRLAADKGLFRELIAYSREDPYIWSKCEEDIVEDKIVLWDDMDRNIRVRLRMSTAPQQRLAHCHRFSFSNLVLKGEYIHWHYHPLPSFDEDSRLDDVVEVGQCVDRAGDVFTIHHDTLHSTPFTAVETVSLVLRGNPVKERAPVMFKEPRGREEAHKQRESSLPLEIEPEQAQIGEFFWRVGEEGETPERRQERQMRRSQVDYWIERFEDCGLLDPCASLTGGSTGLNH